MIASTEVDKTGASYYGEQTLHYLAVNGETALVQLREYFRAYNGICVCVGGGLCQMTLGGGALPLGTLMCCGCG